MKTYRVDEHQIYRPLKFVSRTNGCEVTSNDGTIKIELRHTVVLEGSMENSYYYTVIWIRDGGGWIKGDSSQRYSTKEDFIKTIREVEEFTQAVSDYEYMNN